MSSSGGETKQSSFIVFKRLEMYNISTHVHHRVFLSLYIEAVDFLSHHHVCYTADVKFVSVSADLN